jgi:hypothetical protein
MLKVMRGGDEGEAITDRQLQAAISAAPYVHPKLSTLRGDSNAPLSVSLTGADIERLTCDMGLWNEAVGFLHHYARSRARARLEKFG